MKKFRDKYLQGRAGYDVLDVGSRQYSNHRTYRQLFHMAQYTGLDVVPGPNVDIVASNPYAWALENESFDVVISGQCFEHCEWFWSTFHEMVRVLKEGGFICVIAPYEWHQHGYPTDCWRFLPDGMTALGKWQRVTTLDAYLSGKDCVGIFQK